MQCKCLFTFSLATIGIDMSSMSTNMAACSRKFSAKLASSPFPLALSSTATKRKLTIHHKIHNMQPTIFHHYHSVSAYGTCLAGNRWSGNQPENTPLQQSQTASAWRHLREHKITLVNWGNSHKICKRKKT